MLFGAISKLTITVEPVVVIPDILSKKASVIFKFKLENTKGRDPKIAILNHESAVNRKAWGKFNFLSWSMFDKKNNIPKTKMNIHNIKTDTKYDMLKVILETNLELMKMAEVSSAEEKDIVTYSVLKGLIDFTSTMDKSYNIPKS